jgi:hypothetical protein
MVEGDWFAEVGVIDAVFAVLGSSVFNVGSRVGGLSVDRLLKGQVRWPIESGVLVVVVARELVGFVEASLCSPGRLCRGVAAGFAALSWPCGSPGRCRG